MSALSNIDLDRILKRDHVTKKGYLGAYPACEIPISKKTRYFFITNTDRHDKPGKHWTAWMVEGDKVEFFDSFGRSPNNKQFPYEFKDFILEKMFRTLLLEYSNIPRALAVIFACTIFISVHWV